MRSTYLNREYDHSGMHLHGMMADMARSTSLALLLTGSLVGGLTAYFAGGSYWQASVISLAFYGAVMLIDQALAPLSGRRSAQVDHEASRHEKERQKTDPEQGELPA